MPEPGIASENHMENVVWLALESLEPKYRILLYLYYYEGYSIRELTAVLKRKRKYIADAACCRTQEIERRAQKAGEIPQNWEREGK